VIHYIEVASTTTAKPHSERKDTPYHPASSNELSDLLSVDWKASNDVIDQDEWQVAVLGVKSFQETQPKGASRCVHFFTLDPADLDTQKVRKN